MKYLIVGDIHLSDRPPSMRTSTYLDDILDKLRFTVEVAKSEAVDGVIWSGDVFHIKAPSRTSHRTVQVVAEIGNAYGCPWYIVPGNHDLSNDRIDSLSSQPLGVLYKTGAIPLIGHMGADLPYGIPWLQDWAQLSEAFAEWKYWPRNRANSLVVTHAPIFPAGMEPPYDYISAPDWAELQGAGFCYYGHIHDQHGFFQAGNVTFANSGALSRGSLHESDLGRKPRVTIWSPNAGFHAIEVPHKPITEVFHMAEVIAEKAATLSLDTFLGSIDKTVLERVSIEAVLHYMEQMELPQDVRDLIRNLLEEAIAA